MVLFNFNLRTNCETLHFQSNLLYSIIFDMFGHLTSLKNISTRYERKHTFITYFKVQTHNQLKYELDFDSNFEFGFLSFYNFFKRFLVCSNPRTHFKGQIDTDIKRNREYYNCQLCQNFHLFFSQTVFTTCNIAGGQTISPKGQNTFFFARVSIFYLAFQVIFYVHWKHICTVLIFFK